MLRIASSFVLIYCSVMCGHALAQTVPMDYTEYLRQAIATDEEIDVFLHKSSWAQFDPETGYILGNYFPLDGWNSSRTISTVQANGARSSMVYTDKPCRINTYGNSFTQCHQSSDAETWQEYLAGHLGEPIRNFGMGGFGVYQAYRRMLRVEESELGGDHIILYIWGDDHLRSLLRCRYVLIQEWNKRTNQSEGVGRMFHGNFWSNIEMNLKTGELQEHESRIRRPEDLHLMANEAWMLDNLHDDIALQMYLYKQGKIKTLPWDQISLLAAHLEVEFDGKASDLREEVGHLLDQYGYAATKYILASANAFAAETEKKLMVILFDPYGAMYQMLRGEVRKDQTIVDFLEENDFTYFDMNEVHVADYEHFNIDLEAYYERYFIGHYNPHGNHFFAYSVAPHVVEWLTPEPIPYRLAGENLVDFKDYLPKRSKGR